VRTFIHPVDLGDELNNINCSECHQPPKARQEEGKDKGKDKGK
jgi:hypothetical protein